MNKAVKQYVSATCPICGRVYLLGTNGTCDGCDRCTQTVRDHHGYAWGRGEKEMEFLHGGTVQRSDVFKKRR